MAHVIFCVASFSFKPVNFGLGRLEADAPLRFERGLIIKCRKAMAHVIFCVASFSFKPVHFGLGRLEADALLRLEHRLV